MIYTDTSSKIHGYDISRHVLRNAPKQVRGAVVRRHPQRQSTGSPTSLLPYTHTHTHVSTKTYGTGIRHPFRLFFKCLKLLRYVTIYRYIIIEYHMIICKVLIHVRFIMNIFASVCSISDDS